MGCDIHAYLEHRTVYRSDDEVEYWTCFASDVGIGRNYELFSLMAGVRTDPRRADTAPLVPPRGLPEHPSFTVIDEYTIYVDDEFPNAEGSCSSDTANGWVSEGSSQWWNDKQSRVTNPDWHTPSWLTLPELEDIQQRYAVIEMAPSSWYQAADGPIPDGARVVAAPDFSSWGRYVYVEMGERVPLGEYKPLKAVIAAMRELERDDPGSTRLVFWFDN